MPSNSHRDRGAAAVEFALLLPVLLMLVFGIVDFSRAFQANIALTQAVREAVRPLALELEEDGLGPVALAEQRFDATVQTSSIEAASLGELTTCTGSEGNAVAEGTATVALVTPIGSLLDGITETVFTLNGRAEMRCGG